MLKPRLAEAAPWILALLLDGIQFNVCKYSRPAIFCLIRRAKKKLSHKKRLSI